MLMFNIFHKYLIFTIFSIIFSLNTPNKALAIDENDPFEKVNRNIFDFNNTLDDNFFQPIAKGWRKLPDIPRKPLSNLATTAKTPVSLANAVLQLNRENIGNILARFLINMTFGLGGMFDMAGSEEFGSIPDVEEDFGQTLATWGVPDGPYVMLPIFGPSSIRDSIGLGIDAVFNPLSFGYRMNGIGIEARLSGPVVRGVTQREKYLDYVDEMKASSLDFYATMRSLYRQKRKKEITGHLEEENTSLNNLPVEEYNDEFKKKIVKLSKDVENVKEIKLTNPEENIMKKAVKVSSSMLPSSNYPGSSNVNDSYVPRIYNGIMPSSNYPGFSKSRVNLIN